MIRKIVAALLVCVIFITIASCSTKGDTPDNTGDVSGTPTATKSAEPPADEKAAAFAAYTLAAEKLDTQYDIDFDVTVDMLYENENYGGTLAGNMKMATVGNKKQYSYNALFNGESNIAMYSDGDNIYNSVDGIERQISVAEAQSLMSDTLKIPTFQESAIKSATYEETDGGAKIIAVLDGGALNDYAEQVLGEQYSALGVENGMDVSDITLTIVTDVAGNPLSMDIDLGIEIVVREADFITNAAYKYSFNKLGSGVVMDLPKIPA